MKFLLTETKTQTIFLLIFPSPLSLLYHFVCLSLYNWCPLSIYLIFCSYEYILANTKMPTHVFFSTFMWPWIVTNFLTIKPTRCTNFLKFILKMKLYMFRTVPLSIIRSYSPYTQQWYMSYRFVDSFQAGSGWNCSSIMILLLESCLYDIYHCWAYSE
jgi:hypothetical protein